MTSDWQARLWELIDDYALATDSEVGDSRDKANLEAAIDAEFDGHRAEVERLTRALRTIYDSENNAGSIHCWSVREIVLAALKGREVE